MFLQLASHFLTAERRVDRQPCSTSRFPTCGAHMCPANLRLPLPTDPWLVRPTHPWFRGQLCATERPGITRPRTSLQGSHGHRGGCRHGACSRRPAASPHSGAAPLQHCGRAPPHGGAAALQHCGGDRRGIKPAAAAPPHSLVDRHRPITVLRHPPPPPTTPAPFPRPSPGTPFTRHPPPTCTPPTLPHLHPPNPASPLHPAPYPPLIAPHLRSPTSHVSHFHVRTHVSFL